MIDKHAVIVTGMGDTKESFHAGEWSDMRLTGQRNNVIFSTRESFLGKNKSCKYENA